MICFKITSKRKQIALIRLHEGAITCADPVILRGTLDPDTYPLENYKAKEFLYNTGLDPLENPQTTKPAFNDGPLSARQHKMPFRTHRSAFNLPPSTEINAVEVVLDPLWQNFLDPSIAWRL